MNAMMWCIRYSSKWWAFCLFILLSNRSLVCSFPFFLLLSFYCPRYSVIASVQQCSHGILSITTATEYTIRKRTQECCLLYIWSDFFLVKISLQIIKNVYERMSLCTNIDLYEINRWKWIYEAPRIRFLRNVNTTHTAQHRHSDAKYVHCFMFPYGIK